MRTTFEDDIKTATAIVRETGRGSFSTLQRRMKIGYPYADTLIRKLEQMGVLGPINADGMREVIKETA